MAKPKRTLRIQTEHDIMTWFNDHEMQGMTGSKVYDFGSLGLLQIWWARFGWEMRWLEVEKPPEGIGYDQKAEI